MRGNDVDGFESGREVWVGGEGRQIENEEDEAVFAAIIGKREGANSRWRWVVRLFVPVLRRGLLGLAGFCR